MRGMYLYLAQQYIWGNKKLHNYLSASYIQTHIDSEFTFLL